MFNAKVNDILYLKIRYPDGEIADKKHYYLVTEEIEGEKYQFDELLDIIIKSSITNKPIDKESLFPKTLLTTFFFFCTLLFQIFKKELCNSDLQWAYLYHTFKNLSSGKFILQILKGFIIL